MKLINTKQLSADAKFYESYSRYDETLERYETWEESVSRVMEMHYTKYADLMSPDLRELVEYAKEKYNEKLVLGAQRALQFGGEQLLKHEAKIYNCTSTHLDRIEFFGEFMYFLLCGAGVGFSVQKQHILKLPKLTPRSNRVIQFVIPDSIEGWSEAIDVLFSSFLNEGGKFPQYNGKKVYFDFSKIRGKGEIISGGFKAPGPEPLRKCIAICEEMLTKISYNGGIVSSIEAYDMAMMLADAVISGGVRRAATICLFSKDDEKMLSAKTGNWFVDNPQRARSNNSVILQRDEITLEDLQDMVQYIKQFGEPGFILTDNKEFTYNPCFTKDTRFLTVDGWRTFGEMEGKTATIVQDNRARGFLNDGGEEEWVVDPTLTGVTTNEVNKIGLTQKNVNVYKMTLECGRQIKATANHSFATLDGMVPLEEMIGGDSVLIGLNKLNIDSPTVIFIPKTLNEIKANYTQNNLHLCNVDYKKLVLRTVFGHNYYFKDTDLTFLRDLQLVLQEFGIFSTIRNEILHVPEPERINFKAVLFTENEDHIIITKQRKYSSKISSIEFCGTEDVYCLEENNRRTLIAEGMVARRCVEIGMLPVTEDGESGFETCNLTEINGSMCNTKEKFYEACKAASILGTLQAGYTNFKYLSDATRKIVEREALIGVSVTGWMNNPHVLFDEEVMQEGAEIVKHWNKIVSEMLGINQAARTTCVKPAGNTSVLLQTANGIHGEHASTYFRHIMMNKETEVAKALVTKFPEMIEDSVWSTMGTDYCVAFPFVAHENSIFKSDLYGIKQLEYVKKAQQNWVEYGTNEHLCTDKRLRHNVSNTITVDDWDEVIKYVYDNKQWFAGVSFISMSGDKDFAQAPNASVLNEEQIVEKYGAPALFASGLICQGLDNFNSDLWLALSTASGNGLDISEEIHTNVGKQTFIKRVKKYAERYFENNLIECINCMKDVYYLHKWTKIQNALRNQEVNWSELLTSETFTDIDTMGAIACSGVKGCEI